MIVREDGDRLLLITQPDHAQMAGRIMEHCRRLKDLPRRASILRACAEHDGGWIEVDDNPEVEPATGRVIDFMTASAQTKQTVWSRAIARLQDDPWAAALVANHAITVYSRFHDDAEWTAFFRDMTASRDALANAARCTITEIDAEYPFVRLADLISLIFCNEWTEPQSFGPWTVRGEGTHVSVAPDAFHPRTVSFEIPARAMAAQRFESTEQLHNEIRHGTPIILRGTVGPTRQ